MVVNILKVLPDEIQNQIYDKDNITEIRLRCGTSCILKSGSEEVELDYMVTKEDILNVLKKVSDSSIYAVQKDINQGFLTIKGGHRIGIAGEVIIEEEKIVNIKNISSINIRVASEIKGAASNVLDKILDDGIYNSTLIVSPPRLW